MKNDEKEGQSHLIKLKRITTQLTTFSIRFLEPNNTHKHTHANTLVRSGASHMQMNARHIFFTFLFFRFFLRIYFVLFVSSNQTLSHTEMISPTRKRINGCHFEHFK